jgi:signal peptidase I
MLDLPQNLAIRHLPFGYWIISTTPLDSHQAQIMNPPVIPRQHSTRMKLRWKMLIGVGAAIPLFLIVSRLFGLLIPFQILNGSMKPALSIGDCCLMEGFTYLMRPPQRGDIVVFTVKDNTSPWNGHHGNKRIVGLPGEKLRIADGQLYVNGQIMEIRNREGVIQYVNYPNVGYLRSSNETIIVRAGEYFVLGDNSEHSLDSRMLDTIPVSNVRGRMSFCYWPPKNVGAIK